MLVDLRMPDLGGLDVLRAIREIDPRCQAVLMTGYASVDTAVEAIKLGAMDYLSKPLDFARLEQLLTGVRDDIERRRSLLSIESDVARRLEFCGMIGRGPAMQELFGMIRRLAPHVRTALITGETGTGKELVARALHRPARAAIAAFVTVNCSAVVETLFESELFGHVRGAFTGATEQQAGAVRAGRQRHALPRRDRRAAARRCRPSCCACWSSARCTASGRSRRKRVNVHVIAATNRDLRAEVAAGRFRSDLYYRLNIVEVKLPPLRDRREDIPYLTAAFVRETSERLQKPLAGLTPGAERVLGAARVGRQRARAAQRDRARVHPRRRRLHHRARAGRQHARPPDAAAGVTAGVAAHGRVGPARDRRARAHPARAGAREREQEGRGADARV